MFKKLHLTPPYPALWFKFRPPLLILEPPPPPDNYCTVPKVRLNTLLLPPLLSITFVPSAFYTYVWRILDGSGKAHIFSRHIIEMGFV